MDKHSTLRRVVTPVVSLALLSAGFGCSTRSSTTIETRSTVSSQANSGKRWTPAGARSAPAVVPSGWAFQPASSWTACQAGWEGEVFQALEPAREEALPGRLSDHMLDSSPVEFKSLGFDGPVREATHAWERGFASQGMNGGYARTFNSQDRAGGFTICAFQFPDDEAARSAAADAYHRAVCDLGGEPVLVPAQPGIIAALTKGNALAWWVHGDRVIEVDYTQTGDKARDLANAAVVLKAAWEAGTMTRTAGMP